MSGFKETWIFWTDFRKIPKIYENLSSESRAVPYRQKDRQTWRSYESLSTILRTRPKTCPKHSSFISWCL